MACIIASGLRDSGLISKIRGYDYKSMLNPGIIGECTSPVAKGDVVTYAMLKTQSDDQGGAFTTSTTMTSAYHVLGVPINGVIKGVDVMTSTGMSNGSTMGTSTTMGMGTSATTPAGSAGLYATTSSSSSTPAISSGAKAGIGVGVTAGGIAAIALLSFFLLARRRKQANSSNGFSDSNPDVGEKKVYEKGEGQVPGSPFEVDSSPTYELSG